MFDLTPFFRLQADTIVMKFVGVQNLIQMIFG